MAEAHFPSKRTKLDKSGAHLEVVQNKERKMKNMRTEELVAPEIEVRNTFQAELDALRAREKAHTYEGDAISAARRRVSAWSTATREL
jgi:hypothetical protein